MLFVKTQDLKLGMRLAKPIYNKKGVLLYGRDTKISQQGISSIKNFELIGVYILEPAEPLPPLSDEDIEFERFQTMAVFSLKEDMKLIIQGEQPKNINKLVDLIISNYGKAKKRITFTQNLRSAEDYVYKHSLNVAILSALIANQTNESNEDMRNIILCSLLHDIGKLNLNENVVCKDDPDEDEILQIKKCVEQGYSMISNIQIPQAVKRLTAQTQKEIYNIRDNVYEGRDKNLNNGTKIIMVADLYDKLTAMKIDDMPMSEIAVLKKLINDQTYDDKIVTALTESINIITPGVCVELTSGEKGLVITENRQNLLKPDVLSFNTNQIYSLEKLGENLQIKDIMKTMDNRIIIDRKLISDYDKLAK